MTPPVQEMSLARPSRDGLGFEFSVSLIGAIARRSVERIGYGHVIAVFDGSFYVETIGGIVCVARDDLGASPLNILVDVPRTVSWAAAGIRVGARVRFSRHVFHVAGRFAFTTAGYELWTPPDFPKPVSRPCVSDGLRELARISRNNIKQSGLIRFVDLAYCPVESERIGFAAAIPIRYLRDWCIAGFRHGSTSSEPDVSSWGDFVGLGPGLTPSGSDFVGGVMLALTVLGATDMRDRLWSLLRPVVDDMDNPIMAAHLAAAAEGMGSAVLHRVIDAVVTGDANSLRSCIHGLDAIGHTSGWDGLAGVVCALDTWSSAPPLKH